MKCLRRNKTPFWYCLYKSDRVPGDTAEAGVAITGTSTVGDDVRNFNFIIDEYGNETGERILYYAEPVQIRANISPATGRTSMELFGNMENYDKVIVMERDCPIDENTVLFIDREPETAQVVGNRAAVVEELFAVPHPDYVVKRVSRSLNQTAIAVMKVR